MPRTKLGELGFLKMLRELSPIYFKIRRVASSLPYSETEQYIISYLKQDVVTSKLIFGLTTDRTVESEVDIARVVKFPKDQVPDKKQELHVIVLDKQYYGIIWNLFDEIEFKLKDMLFPDFEAVVTH